MRTPDGNFSHDEDIAFLIVAAGLLIFVVAAIIAVYRMSAVVLR